MISFSIAQTEKKNRRQLWWNKLVKTSYEFVACSKHNFANSQIFCNTSNTWDQFIAKLNSYIRNLRSVKLSDEFLIDECSSFSTWLSEWSPLRIPLSWKMPLRSCSVIQPSLQPGTKYLLVKPPQLKTGTFLLNFAIGVYDFSEPLKTKCS